MERKGNTEMIMSLIVLILGFVLLIKGADFFVSGSSDVAKKFNIPSIVIGLTIVSLGTSLPELAVSLTASIHGNNSLAVSNVIGSNMMNLLVVLGASALLNPVKVTKKVLKSDYPLSIAISGVLFVLGILGMRLGRLDGIILVALLVFYLHLQLKAAKNGSNKEEVEKTKEINMKKAIAFIVGGALAIKFGGNFVVNSAVEIAEKFGLSETLIGLTIVAMGTSLPELVTSLVAAKKGEVDMAIGNVVGSNILNVVMILGVSSIISPITFIGENVIDLIIMIALSLVVYVYMKSRNELSKVEGMSMLMFYLIYTLYICFR